MHSPERFLTEITCFLHPVTQPAPNRNISPLYTFFSQYVLARWAKCPLQWIPFFTYGSVHYGIFPSTLDFRSKLHWNHASFLLACQWKVRRQGAAAQEDGTDREVWSPEWRPGPREHMSLTFLNCMVTVLGDHTGTVSLTFLVLSILAGSGQDCWFYTVNTFLITSV